jgi:transcriptional regulator GlxA family with amidase domain
MTIALIARDHGHDLAMAVSEWFLHTQTREGVGPQRMDPRFRHSVTDGRVLDALMAMEDNIETPLSRETIARRVGVSLRQLERFFQSQLGVGMHRHYLALRLGRARQLLRESTISILDIAIATGFTSASQFSRAFRKAFGTSPTATRRRQKY